MVRTIDALVLDTIDDLEAVASVMPEHLVINFGESKTIRDVLRMAARILKAYNAEYYLTENDLEQIGGGEKTMGKLTTALSDAINRLGNDLTCAGWPEGKRDGRTYCTSTTFRDLVIVAGEAAGVESDLRSCVNDLCLKCGNYHESYAGACDGCRWKTVKEGFR